MKGKHMATACHRQEKTEQSPKRVFPSSVLYFLGTMVVCFLLSACARMGNPDGGWYDETPPRVIKADPADKETNVKQRKISIYFNEFVQITNATEDVVVSPPQLEIPEIKAAGKKIVVELKDSLKENTTYTVDFSDAITDNNENNPLGIFTYSFSTGDHIDTLEVSGYVIEAENLEPVKGILVGLYPATAETPDSIFRTQPFQRVARTDGNGRFTIKGIAPGSYRAFALQDVDNNYRFSQKSEKIAFNHDIIVPSFKPDVKQDTIWSDSLHIRSITPVDYTHFLPDDIVLKTFTEVQTDRYLLKTERKQANRIDFFFTYGHEQLPEIKGLNFNEQDAFLVECSLNKDTISYWLRDSVLINQDTLSMQVSYYATDTTGVLQLQTDTLEALSKDPYEKRLKKMETELKEWKNKQEKEAKKGNAVSAEMPARHLQAKWNSISEGSPDQIITVTFDSPIVPPDTTKLHLYAKIDTTWYEAPFTFREREQVPRTYELLTEWMPGVEYSLETDSAAFRNIYGLVSEKHKSGFKVKSTDEFCSLSFTFEGMAGKPVIAYLVDRSDNVVKKVDTEDGHALFSYIKPGSYYVRILVDENRNGRWDTGNYDEDLQPESVFYYPKEIECKEKWDITLSWAPEQTNILNQKPGILVKQKDAKTKKTIKNRNAERARKMGIEYVPNER